MMARFGFIAGAIGLSLGLTSAAQAAVLPIDAAQIAGNADRAVLADYTQGDDQQLLLAHRGCYSRPGIYYYGGGYYRPYYRSYYRPYYDPWYGGGYGYGRGYYGPRVGFYISF